MIGFLPPLPSEYAITVVYSFCRTQRGLRGHRVVGSRSVDATSSSTAGLTDSIRSNTEVLCQQVYPARGPGGSHATTF